LGAITTVCSGTVLPGDICARKPHLAFFALAGKQTWWILAIEVDVAEHCRCTFIALVIEVIVKRAREFLECGTALAGWKLRSFALACDDCVVLELKVHRATILGLQQAPPCRSGARLEDAIGQERTVRGRGELSHYGGREEEDQEPTPRRHRHASSHRKQELDAAAAAAETPGWLASKEWSSLS